MIIIPNDGGKRLCTLQRPDGSLIDVYSLADLPGAIIEAIGPQPAAPVMGMGYFDRQATPIALTDSDGNQMLMTVENLTYIASSDGLNSALASVYAQAVAAYNARVAAITAMMPGIIAAAGKG